MSGMLLLSRWIDSVTVRLGKFVGWLCLAMVLIGAYNAVVRYLGRYIHMNLSSNVYLELQWYLFACLFLLGAAATLRHDAHVRVDVFYGRLTPRNQAWLNVAGTLLFLLPFCVFGVVSSWDYTMNSIALREMSPDPGGLPRYPIKAMIPIGFGLLGLQAISQLIKHIAVITTTKNEANHGG